ncbi:PREDICTED: protein regulator of cytokinesis 1-like isoform X1 [Drosophila arizonae]|uniref:Protein regulator of cytokinesis 1-like isoform X1 n=1 Tax=Drosophila arizonae TaxID=7263 RepID=A0ABM1PZA2_DROAR|nr:PREDICTED: protein regulator of cytokinesis 1-like isoform X1 [Drosophila arizonae]
MAEQSTAKSTIVDITSDHVDRLFSKWTSMFDETYCLELMDKLGDRVKNFYCDLLTESNEKEKAIMSNISDLLEEAADIRRLLHKNLDIGEKPEEMPLDVWLQTLDKSIEHLRAELRERRAEICELLLQQDQLCEELGECPLPLLADPLPKPDEMSSFCKHLEHLRAVRERRLEELFQLRSQIKQDMMLLSIMPTTPAEEHLLSQANQHLTPNILEKLRLMQKEFAAQVQEMREQIDDMRGKIYELWERLQESDEYIMRRVRSAVDYTQATFDVLREELQRCQALRRKNLKTFIEQLRLEIKKWWDLTLKSEQERKRFSNFFNEWYNEDLLELHELELDDLKSFYTSNKEIFELFASRSEFWARMEALEAKANDPNRFNNRGGQLLKEERERKAIGTKLPKIEQQITELVKAYEMRNQCPFLVYGENILDRMANDWVRLRQAKEQQSSARKQGGASNNGKMLPPATPGSTAPRTPLSLRNMSAMSSSTMSLRKTPSTLQLSSMASSAAKTTGNLHKRKLPNGENSSREETPTAKRSLMRALSTLKPSPAMRKPNQRLAVVQQKPNQRLAAVQQKPKRSPMKKVLVLQNTMRSSSGVGRRSVGQSGKKRRSKFDIPTILYPSSSDEQEQEKEQEPDPEDIVNYNKFSPKVRSSELPRALTTPRSAFLANKDQKQYARKELNEDLAQAVELPEPRRSRMWELKHKK